MLTRVPKIILQLDSFHSEIQDCVNKNKKKVVMGWQTVQAQIRLSLKSSQIWVYMQYLLNIIYLKTYEIPLSRPHRIKTTSSTKNIILKSKYFNPSFLHPGPSNKRPCGVVQMLSLRPLLASP